MNPLPRYIEKSLEKSQPDEVEVKAYSDRALIIARAKNLLAYANRVTLPYEEYDFSKYVEILKAQKAEKHRAQTIMSTMPSTIVNLHQVNSEEAPEQPNSLPIADKPATTSSPALTPEEAVLREAGLIVEAEALSIESYDHFQEKANV